MQIILTAIAVAATMMVFRPGRWQGRFISSALAFFWAWMAVVYHFVFFTAINAAAWIFGLVFLAGAFCFISTGTLHNRLQFQVRESIRGWTGGILIIFALVVYPLIGYFQGHRYPTVPTFGLPCPTTIFTIGMLLFVGSHTPRLVFVVPLIWSVIGSAAAFQLGVLQDLGLLVAGVIGAVAFVLTPAPGNQSAKPQNSVLRNDK
jgi:hypothetical protein